MFNTAHSEMIFQDIKMWRIHQFFSTELLDFINAKILPKEFVLREYGPKENLALYTELIHASKYTEMLQLFMQDQAMIESVARLTGLQDLGKVGCRVYKFIPNSGQNFGWHDDMSTGRLIGFSVNLSKAPFEGGVFRIRKKHDHSCHFEFQNLGYGDAILFSIGDELEHSVTAITGVNERIACAGWFYGKDSEVK